MRLQDKLIRDQAILRHKERQSRQKREIPIPQGPGWTCIGSVFDCNREHFERLLSNYWENLYVGWNPMKNEGRGCWEVWQRPLRKTSELCYHDETTGLKIYKADYKPNDYEHWVADLDYLSYDFIEKLKAMDTWSNKTLVADHDEKFEKFHDKLEQDEEAHIKYVVRHNKQAFRDLLDYTQQGYDPTQFFYRK